MIVVVEDSKNPCNTYRPEGSWRDYNGLFWLGLLESGKEVQRTMKCTSSKLGNFTCELNALQPVKP